MILQPSSTMVKEQERGAHRSLLLHWALGHLQQRGKDPGDGGKLGRTEISFTAQLQGWLTVLAKFWRQYKGSHDFIFLSLVHHVRCECPELARRERLAASANIPGSSALLGRLWQLPQELQATGNYEALPAPCRRNHDWLCMKLRAIGINFSGPRVWSPSILPHCVGSS